MRGTLDRRDQLTDVALDLRVVDSLAIGAAADHLRDLLGHSGDGGGKPLVFIGHFVTIRATGHPSVGSVATPRWHRLCPPSRVWIRTSLVGAQDQIHTRHRPIEVQRRQGHGHLDRSGTARFVRNLARNAGLR